MKLNKIILCLTAVVILSSLSCASLFTKGGMSYEAARRAYKDKDYVTAVDKAMTALNKNPEYAEAENLLVQAFTEGTQFHLNKAEKGVSEGGINGLETALESFRYLVNLHKTGSITGNQRISIQDFSGKVEETRDHLVEAYYLAGVKALNEEDYKKARDAVAWFKKVLGQSSDYKDTADLLEQAMDEAVAVIAVSAGNPETNDWAATVLSFLALESEYIKIEPWEKYPGNGMVGPLDQMMNTLLSGKVDFVINISSPRVNLQATEVRNHNVLLPVENPIISSGYEHGYDYNNTYSVEYTVYGSGAKIVDQGVIEGQDQGSFRLYRSYWDKEDETLIFNDVESEWDMGTLIPGLDDGSIQKGFQAIKEKTLSEMFTLETVGEGYALRDYYLDQFISFDEMHEYFGDPIFTVVDGYYDPTSDSYYFQDGRNYEESNSFKSKSWNIGMQVTNAMLQRFKEDKLVESKYYGPMAMELTEYVTESF